MNKKDILKQIETAKNPKNKNLIFGTSNKKLSSQGIISFDMTAIQTCPFANDCKEYCYAEKIQKRYPNVAKKWAKNYEISQSYNFVNIANESLKALPNTKFVRVHSSGDFYNLEYAKKWVKIAKMNRNIVFYAYTKSQIFFKNLALPENFLIVQSLPMLKDVYFNPNLKVAQIFYSLEDYNNAIEYGNYIGAKDEDLEAVKAMILGKNIALLDHSVKAKINRESKKNNK